MLENCFIFKKSSKYIFHVPLIIFFTTLLNISGINAHVIYTENANKTINRGQFLKDLCVELVPDYKNIREKHTRGIPIHLSYKKNGQS